VLKADVSDAGEGWSDSMIAGALDTSIATVERIRRQLAEFGPSSAVERNACPCGSVRIFLEGLCLVLLVVPVIENDGDF
jgi:hypothetical protein